ncbi:RecF/RecN/SMC [Zopfochytrium polystomum]|nr:RecF/RecN/SMC [Zopfochytrium polystomum]
MLTALDAARAAASAAAASSGSASSSSSSSSASSSSSSGGPSSREGSARLTPQPSQQQQHPQPAARRPAPAPPHSPPIKRDPDAPRLVISKMVLRNFKSYAGSVEIGPFHKSFSAIVGPNGSGKSNVIDALLFVFGFKAKKMRQGKLSDLIHHSAAFPNLDSCGVEVHFQDIIDLPGDAFRVVENSQLVISRTVEREKNDKSTYRINGRPSTFTEVTDLLKMKDVDLDHKRFLILQGEVESIALMKPKAGNEHEDGLLEYLEDIIGTTKYKTAIEEGCKQVETVSEERDEKLNRLKIIEKEKKALEVWTTDELTAKLEEMKGDLEKASSLFKESEESHKECLASFKHFDDDMKKTDDEIQELSRRIQLEEKELDVIREKLKKKTSGLQAEIEARQQELAPWLEQINSKQVELNVAKSERDMVSKRIEEAMTVLQDTQDKLAKYKEGIQKRGRLGDLGVIDDKYDVAVTTACGALDSIVVETVEAGQKCIAYLKQNQIASNLEQANRIAYGANRFRVVTLEGQLIDTSGTMSGGGQKPLRGGMSAKFSGGESLSVRALEQLAKEQQTAEDDLNSLFNKIENLERTLVNAQGQIPIKETELAKVAIEYKSLIDLHADCERQIRALSEIDKLNRKIEQISRSAQPIEDAVKELQEKILQAGGIELRSQKAKVDNLQEQLTNCNERLTQLKVEKNTREKSVAKMQKAIEKKEAELQDAEEQLAELRTKEQKKIRPLNDIRKQLKDAEEVREEMEQKLGALKKDLDEKSEEMAALKAQAREIAALQGNTVVLKLVFNETYISEKLAGMNPNMSVLEEYRKKMTVYQTRVQDVEAITAKRDKAKENLEALRKKRLDEFLEGFTSISQKLKEMYQMITLGGNAELELVDSMDPFSEGIVFSVMPPKKSWKNIANLSGGEKTLSSLALVFALHHYKPTPLYVMDEIDAALDFRNVSIIGNYIKERTRNAQFVIISLRNNMFELADRLVGIYKTSDTTKSISINPSTPAFHVAIHPSMPRCEDLGPMRLESWIQSDKPFKAISSASEEGHVDVLECWREFGQRLFDVANGTLPSHANAGSNTAAKRGHVQVLEWWRNSGSPVDWTDSTALGSATENG